MLLCCSGVALNKAGVQEEIGIAEKSARRSRTRTSPSRCASASTRNFSASANYSVSISRRAGRRSSPICSTRSPESSAMPCDPTITINPAWKAHRRRAFRSRRFRRTHVRAPDLELAAYRGGAGHRSVFSAVGCGQYRRHERGLQFVPVSRNLRVRGFLSFRQSGDVLTGAHESGRQIRGYARGVPFQQFLEEGIPEFIKPQEASNLIISTLRRSWENFCRAKRPRALCLFGGHRLSCRGRCHPAWKKSAVGTTRRAPLRHAAQQGAG